jgi:membrane-bound lytic murein transglycosylase F
MVAQVASRIYPNIDVSTPLSFRQKIAWAVKKDQVPLLDTLNAWLFKFNRTLEARLLYNKYFKNVGTKSITNTSYLSYQGGKLSPYDAIIKEAANKIGWDWRLLASVIYQESGFKKNLRSWVGAYGLMQMMPDAMASYNIDTLSSPKDQIMAGASYLKSLEHYLPDSITDSVERIKFTLACYNGGMSHVLDARRLAKKYGKNPNIWTDNVDYYVLHLSENIYYDDPVVSSGYMRGWETYRFVRDIFRRFHNYQKLINSRQLVLSKIKAR